MPQPDAANDEHFAVVVVRSGGLAGLQKQWRAEPDPARLAQWRELVEDCPWDAAPSASSGADRYEWRIEVHRGGIAVRRVRLDDGQVDGPWRTLVDEVRRAAPSQPRSR